MTPKSKGWGGKRANAGRKPSDFKAIPKTKPCRITQAQCNFIKSGKFEQLQTLIWDWHQRMLDDPYSETSPRWQRMKEFLIEVEEIYNGEEDWFTLIG